MTKTANYYRTLFCLGHQPERSTTIIEGNEKVVRPRLTDAEFFFKTDLKQNWLIVYHV